MIKILKASAGSGKTYNLAQTYIRLLLENDDPQAYRHILAVTFTNKATDEMKGRILRELHLLSADPGKSPYAKDFVPSLFDSPAVLKKKAEDVLYGILHDYGAFAVSTIDRFFQQTLKAFSREIGQFASYQVELDKDSLVHESVDRILDSLTENDKALLKWLGDSAMEQLEQGRRPNLEGSLYEMASRLKSDEHRAVVEEYGIDETKAYSKDNLARMKAGFRKVIEEYRKALAAASKAVEDAFAGCGVSPYDTSRGFMGGTLSKFKGLEMPGQAGHDGGGGHVPGLSATFRAKAVDFSTWFKKADHPRYAGLEGILQPPVARLVETYDRGIKTYNTARMLLGQVNDLGIASELSSEFQSLLKEKNVLSLDDSNMILKGIIDGSDAPFIYEKIGVRFEHYLLDEFQDTSRVQWDNFMPLIANSDSEGFENLLVGDVKQSIYRWRGSDWKLMARDVAAQFPKAVQESLKGNWRSLRNVVEFNNGFFSYAACLLDSFYGESTGISVSEIYGKSEGQDVMLKDRSEGSVEAIFCNKEDEEARILETVAKVLEAGAQPGDITILVRNNSEGSSIAKFLMECGMDVISDDSLRLKSSLMVRKLVSLISAVRGQGDTIGSYLAKQAGLDSGTFAYHSLYDLCEKLYRTLAAAEDPNVLREETRYIQSFMDYVQDFASTHGNSPDAFLKAWDEADPKVSSSSDSNAVRVMTIHKAKGLEFPYVILPYSEKVGLYRMRYAWTVPDVEGTALEGLGDNAAFDVLLSTGSGQTLFEEDYRRELLLQYIDNINTFYVALTRASKGMTIISDISAGRERNFAGILRGYLEDHGEAEGFSKEGGAQEEPVIFRKGQTYDFRDMDREGDDVSMLEPGFPSFPLNPGQDEAEGDVRERGRLKFAADSVDFFSDEERPGAGARHNGTVLHDILSRVMHPSDLPAAVSQAVGNGDLEASRETEVLELLSARIAGHPEWFPSSGGKVLNEAALFDTDGREWRPDRVVLDGRSATIIDYKFGEHDPRYRRQVARYADIYRRLGYSPVNTAIWYVASDEVET